MSPDRWRLLLMAFSGALFGWMFDHALLGLVAGLGLYIYLLESDTRTMLEWLRHYREDRSPVLHGLQEDVIREIEVLRNHYRLREDKLSQFLQRFQDATTALPDALVMLNPDNRIEWANVRAAEYLGINWPQDHKQRVANLIRYPQLLEYLEQGDSERDGKGLSLPAPDDPQLKLEYRVMPYGDNLKLLIARDITQIEQINQMRRDFIANASHELRTPLTVIAGYLEAMEDDSVLQDAGLVPQVRQMRTQAARMQALIEDLLMLSALETGRPGDKPQIVSVAEMLENIQREAISLSGLRAHDIRLNADSDIQLRGDHNQLYSAFSNLVVNAVQYTPPGGTISIDWYADNDGAHMQVADTGEGIAAEHIPRLTERFYRVDKGRSRDSGGTGLGLAIVKHILSRHQARLHIESEPKKGSVFQCNFPPQSVVLRSQKTQTG